MAKHLSRFILSLKDWLFPKDIPNRQEKTKNDDKEKKYNPYVNSPQQEGRVIHQYPKKGDFTFPLVKDNEILGRSLNERKNKKRIEIPNKNEYEKNQQIKIGNEGNETEPNLAQREKFSGKGFSSTVSPSPVYGYRQRPIKNKVDIDPPLSQSLDITNTDSELDFSASHKEVKLGSDEASITEEIEKSKPKGDVVHIKKVKDMDAKTDSNSRHIQEDTTLKNDEDKINRGDQSKNVNKDNAPKALPYNVMMFQRDRMKAKKRKMIEQEGYAYPPLHLLTVPMKEKGLDEEWIKSQVTTLNETFEYFRIGAKVVHVTKGPSVTRFEIQPEPGVKVSKITNLTDDLKLSLAAKDIRMEAPIPGKNTIGIEVPNQTAEPVFLREILRHQLFQKGESSLTVGLGMDISGEPVVTDLQKMPHGLIAGATGSGKSVCVNSILISLLYKASPRDVRLILIDPKVVELAPYNGIPHLATPVITNPKEATEGLKWAVSEMERRYELFAKNGTRDLSKYNEKMKGNQLGNEVLPYIVIVVDELADLMMVSPQDVEEAICRIAQKARACGIHLLVATQRPSVDVITGLIKANIPTRIAFSVSSQADSRTILDGGGAERLLGKGDMLFLENGSGKPVRLQGTFVSDEEIDRVMEHVKKYSQVEFLFEKEDLELQVEAEAEDDLFEVACDFVMEQKAASASLLQRQFRIGYNRASRLIDVMEDRGIISSAKGSKPRDVYLTKDEIKGKIK
ncbi:DNA translocase FtsK [Evansella sp. AB-P1]|uniref:DNA translocase FtsK n=1 Tax=Evansella sp. AB-P1 TaxID=3037653 RepID=UPI00241FBB0F|nr:DNA translocase FtsK [Evansella sp. AB-P1]MDG5787041.1 DNA translocase FtsK [Evansella sp. AB-P1]